jgi:hypothetical protein
MINRAFGRASPARAGAETTLPEGHCKIALGGVIEIFQSRHRYRARPPSDELVAVHVGDAAGNSFTAPPPVVGGQFPDDAVVEAGIRAMSIDSNGAIVRPRDERCRGSR